MNTVKKLIVAIIVILLFSFSYDSTVNASETDDLWIINVENLSDLTEEVSDTSDISDEDLSKLLLYKDILDPGKYEISVDEQGKVYFAEKDADDSEEDKNDDYIEVKEEESDDSDTKKSKSEKPSYTEEDLRLLACLIYAEAGDQSYEGMLAVANVVLNRVKSTTFSHVKTIKDAIYDDKWGVQFSVTKKDSKSGKSIFEKVLELYDKNADGVNKSMKKAIKAAKAALNGENNIGNYMYFRQNNSKAASIKKKYKYKIIGDHIFYNIK